MQDSKNTLRVINQLQDNIKTTTDPLTVNIQNDSTILTSISLATGSNIINHTLGRTLSGYNIVRQRALANIYDNQDHNKSPNLTLILISSAPVVIDLEVF